MYLKFQFVINFFFFLLVGDISQHVEWMVNQDVRWMSVYVWDWGKGRKKVREREGWCYDDTTLSSSKKIHIFIHIFRIAYFTWRYKYRYVNIGIIRIIYIYNVTYKQEEENIFSRLLFRSESVWYKIIEK